MKKIVFIIFCFIASASAVFGVDFYVENPFDHDLNVSIRYQSEDGAWVSTKMKEVCSNETRLTASSSNTVFYFYAEFSEFKGMYIGNGDNWRPFEGCGYSVPYTKVSLNGEDIVDGRYTYVIPGNSLAGYFTTKYWGNAPWNSSQANVIAFEKNSFAEINYDQNEDEVSFDVKFTDDGGFDVRSAYSYLFLEGKLRATQIKYFYDDATGFDEFSVKLHKELVSVHGFIPENYTDHGSGQVELAYCNGLIHLVSDYIYLEDTLYLLAPDLTKEEFKTLFPDAVTGE